MYRSSACCPVAFTLPCGRPHVRSPGLCRPPQLKLPPRQTLAPPSSLPAAPVTGNRSSTFCFHELDCSWYLVWVESKAFAPLPLAYVTMDHVFKVHAVACAKISSLFQAWQYSTVHKHHTLRVYPSISGHLGCCPLLVLVNSVMSMGVPISLWAPAFSSFGCEIYTVILCLIFRDRHTGGYHFTFPPTVHSGSHSPHFHQPLLFLFFFFSTLIVATLMNMKSHFLSCSWCRASLCVLVGHLNVLF